MNSIKKIGMITGFSIVLGAGVFMTNININNLFNDKVVYSDINEKVKEIEFKNYNPLLTCSFEEVKKILEKYCKIEETKVWEDIFFIKAKKIID